MLNYKGVLMFEIFYGVIFILAVLFCLYLVAGGGKRRCADCGFEGAPKPSPLGCLFSPLAILAPDLFLLFFLKGGDEPCPKCGSKKFNY